MEPFKPALRSSGGALPPGPLPGTGAQLRCGSVWSCSTGAKLRTAAAEMGVEWFRMAGEVVVGAGYNLWLMISYLFTIHCIYQ